MAETLLGADTISEVLLELKFLLCEKEQARAVKLLASSNSQDQVHNAFFFSLSKYQVIHSIYHLLQLQGWLANLQWYLLHAMQSIF